jgi:hypothetical protein
VGGAVERTRPAGGLEPECRGQRLLKQRASGDRIVAVPAGQRGGCRRRRAEVDQQRLPCPPCDEHHRGVQNVLTGGAAVHVRSGLRAGGGLQRAHERYDRVAGRGGVPPN